MNNNQLKGFNKGCSLGEWSRGMALFLFLLFCFFSSLQIAYAISDGEGNDYLDIGDTSELIVRDSNNLLRVDAANNDVEIGAASTTTGGLTFYNSSNANPLTIQPGATGADLTFTLPTAYGTNGYQLTTNGSGVLTWGAAGGASIEDIDDDSDTRILVDDSGAGDDVIRFDIGDSGFGSDVEDILKIGESSVAFIWNDGNNNADVRFAGQSEDNLFYLDASEDRVGIGTNTPGVELEVVGSFEAGGGNTVTGSNASAIGSSNTASGDSSFAAGNTNTATQFGAISLGYGNDVTVSHGFAAGQDHTVTGTSAAALGIEHTAPSYGELVVGTFATTYTANAAGSFDAADRIFTVGNGANSGSRSNAMTILKNGNVGIGTESPDALVNIEGAEDTELFRITDSSDTFFSSFYIGEGDPDGSLTAAPGSLFFDHGDGATTAGALYVNTSIGSDDDWEAVAGATLDDAYDAFGAADSKIDVDAAESQTNGLEFELTTPNMIIDMQSTGDFVIQDAATDIAIFHDDGDIEFGDAEALEIPNDADPTLDEEGEIAIDLTDHTLILRDDAAERVIAHDIYQISATIYADSDWANEEVPFWISPKDMAVEIVQLDAAILGTGGSFLMNVEKRDFGSIGSSGTDILNNEAQVDSSGDTYDTSVAATYIDSATVDAKSHLVFTTNASPVQAGTVDVVTFTIYYRKTVE